MFQLKVKGSGAQVAPRKSGSPFTGEGSNEDNHKLLLQITFTRSKEFANRAMEKAAFIQHFSSPVVCCIANKQIHNISVKIIISLPKMLVKHFGLGEKTKGKTNTKTKTKQVSVSRLACSLPVN